MAGGRRRGAVARAVADGARPQTADERLEDLMSLADRTGPVDVPENLGNFPPDRRTRGEATPTGRARVTPIRRPRHLTTFEDDALARETAEDLGGEGAAPARARPAPGLPAPDVLEVAGQADVFEDVEQPGDRRRPAAEPEPTGEALDYEEPEEEPFDLAPGETESDDPRDRMIARLQAQLAEANVRDADTATRLARLESGRTAPTPGAASAPLPPELAARAEAIRQEHLPANIFPLNLDDRWLDEHHFDRLQADGLRQLLTAAGQATLGKAYRTYGVEREIEQYHQQLRQAAVEHDQRVADAFWAANPDLEPYAEMVTSKSGELHRLYPTLTAGQFITATSQEVRKTLQRMGVRIPLQPPVTRGVRARYEARATGGLPAPRGDGRVRPATMDMNTGPRAGGLPDGMDRRQKDILDLARMR